MKQMLAAVLLAVLMIGCDNSASVDDTQESAALFGEETMYKTTVASDAEMAAMHGNGPGHDSVRHGRMLGHIKTYVGLTDEQFDSVKVYAATMFLGLKDIRKQVHDTLITREQARELVVAVRAQFVASIKLILTADQLVKFEEWIVKFWNKPPRRGGHGHGHGGRP